MWRRGPGPLAPTVSSAPSGFGKINSLLRRNSSCLLLSSLAGSPGRPSVTLSATARRSTRLFSPPTALPAPWGLRMALWADLVDRSHLRGDGMKTNAVRLLEEMGVAHELRAYEVDLDDLTAETVAEKIGLPAEQVFKTLVVRGDRHGVCFAVVPGNCRLDLKALAKLTGDRKVETVPLKDVQPLTGYVRGGVTVLGVKKAYPVHVDETIQLFEVVSISAGLRGLQILLAPAEYLRATGGRLGPIAAAE